MEEIGSEVSHKIRAAIKAKLIELGAYIDDELPDYIMVMVANKRSRQQMDEDLQLFLGSNTKTFTSWLYTVLQRLQEVTVANFDTKKEAQKSKSEKRKHSNSEDSSKKDSKSPEEQNKISKKHVKKGKDGKKLKKSKYKTKEKEKDRNVKKRQTSSIESEGSDKEKKEEGDKGTELSNSEPNDKNNDDKDAGKNEQKLSDSPVPKVSEKAKNSNSEHEVSSTKSSSPSHDCNEQSKRTPENEPEEEDASVKGNKMDIMEDEFNIEPLKQTKDQMLNEKFNDKTKISKSESQSNPVGMTIKAPTRELLKEHDKIISESEGNVSKTRKKSDVYSEESPSRGETKKPALNRPKKNLQQNQMPDRMKSSSPDAEVLQNNLDSKEEAICSSRRAKRICQRRDHDVEEDENIYNRDGSRSNPFWEKNYSPPTGKNESKNGRSGMRSAVEQKSKIISISKSLEMEKNLGVKIEEHKKSLSKATSSPKKKPISSRIFTIPEPEPPEISSIVKVKPREFVPKDKQANKALILKAVADAEKSVATAHSRNDNDIEPKKLEALFTKNLRGKRYEKLAVTLSNVQAGTGVAERVKSKRVVSVDSENTNAQDRKTESLKDSELSQGFKSIPELTLKNISNQSEDQFISSKTSAMEKNDKYIHCWLEGVEKAVKDDEIVNPSEIDDFTVSFSDEAKEEDERNSSTDEEVTSKKPKKDEESSKNERSGDKSSASTKVNEDEGPQIVVTLDGLTSKAIKDIILRNRDMPNGPLLRSAGKKTILKNDSDEEDIGKRPGLRYKEIDSSKGAGTSKQSGSGSFDKVNRFEKISERFGRINKTSENHEFKEKYYEFERERYEKKYLKYQGTDKEKLYEKLKEKYASARESKNKKLIARLSEKFGKVDREFEDKKRKYSDDDLRYSYYKRVDRATERDAKYSKRDRSSVRSGLYKY